MVCWLSSTKLLPKINLVLSSIELLETNLLENLINIIFQNNNLYDQSYSRDWNLGRVSISNKMSYGKLSWSLKVTRFVFKIVQSLWNFTDTSATLLLRQISKQCNNLNYQSHVFESSWDLTMRHLIGYWKGVLIPGLKSRDIHKTTQSLLWLFILCLCSPSHVHHTCQVTLDISGSPISQKYPGQLDRYGAQIPQSELTSVRLYLSLRD